MRLCAQQWRSSWQLASASALKAWVESPHLDDNCLHEGLTCCSKAHMLHCKQRPHGIAVDLDRLCSCLWSMKWSVCSPIIGSWFTQAVVHSLSFGCSLVFSLVQSLVVIWKSLCFVICEAVVFSLATSLVMVTFNCCHCCCIWQMRQKMDTIACMQLRQSTHRVTSLKNTWFSEVAVGAPDLNLRFWFAIRRAWSLEMFQWWQLLACHLSLSCTF